MNIWYHSLMKQALNKRPDKLLKVGPSQVILHQVITRAQGKKYCETLPAPFEHYGSEFSGGMTIEKTNIDLIYHVTNSTYFEVLHRIKVIMNYMRRE